MILQYTVGQMIVLLIWFVTYGNCGWSLLNGYFGGHTGLGLRTAEAMSVGIFTLGWSCVIQHNIKDPQRSLSASGG